MPVIVGQAGASECNQKSRADVARLKTPVLNRRSLETAKRIWEVAIAGCQRSIERGSGYPLTIACEDREMMERRYRRRTPLKAVIVVLFGMPAR